MRIFYIARDEKVNEVTMFDTYPDDKAGIFVAAEKSGFAAEMNKDHFREDEIPHGSVKRYFLFREDEVDQPHPPSVKNMYRKLVDAGFTVVRRDGNIIKKINPENCEWKHWTTLSTKAAAIRAIQMYLTDERTVEL